MLFDVLVKWKGVNAAIIVDKNFADPIGYLFRPFTMCCGAADKGSDYGLVCRGCYEPIEGYMADGDDSQEEFENYIESDSVLKRFRTFINETFFNYEEWHEHMINKMRG